MKRFLALFITPVLAVTLGLMKIPAVDHWLKLQSSNSDIIIGLFLVSATVLNHIISVVSPFKKYEKLERYKWTLIDNITSDLLGKHLFQGYNIVANVMVPKRVWYCSLEPCSGKGVLAKIACIKKRFFKKLLHPVWLSKDHTLSKNFKITTSQGVSGKSFTEGTPIMVDIPKSINQLNFSEKQKKSISGKGFVISCPIFAVDEKYNRVGTKVIGVVTLSCNKIGSEKLIYDERNSELLTKKITDFSKICSLIL